MLETRMLMCQYSYSPYGKATVYGDDKGNPYRYTGRRFDAESSLYYFRNRMYSSEIGKFLSTDGLGEWEKPGVVYASVGKSIFSSGCSSCESKNENIFASLKNHSAFLLAKYINGMNLYGNYFGTNNVDPFGQNYEPSPGPGVSNSGKNAGSSIGGWLDFFNLLGETKEMFQDQKMQKKANETGKPQAYPDKEGKMKQKNPQHGAAGTPEHEAWKKRQEQLEKEKQKKKLCPGGKTPTAIA